MLSVAMILALCSSQSVNAEFVTCPWICGNWSTANNNQYEYNTNICQNAPTFMADLQAAVDTGKNMNWGSDSVYRISAGNVAFDGVWYWGNLKTGIGWTAWWKMYGEYCTSKGYFSYSNASTIHYANTQSLVFTMAPTATTYSGRVISFIEGKGVEIEGSAQVQTGVTFTSPTFNSPFIYFQNQPKGKIDVRLSSEWGSYASQKPAFNLKDGWSLSSDGTDVSIGEKNVENLFYELAVKRIGLTRNGKNFASKAELVRFLEGSDFFRKLGFTETQRRDSLGYILAKIEKSSNYYLTIMDEESINELSSLSISPKPENLIRKYFAIYPTELPVKTSGDLKFPALEKVSGYSVFENGEMYVSDDMVVNWK